tara:strand:- start:333 stop:818 length:486 start_codon:yes stop_codon:yes gene_type:complete
MHRVQIAWLPPLEEFTAYGGNWNRYLAALYDIFCSDFVKSRPSYCGVRLGLKRHPVIDGKEATFWHLISEGDVESERIPDMRRCERIRWPRPLIENAACPEMKVWIETRKGEERIHLWLESENYLTVLNRRREYLLWTAFFVEHEHQRRKYNKRWERFGGV